MVVDLYVKAAHGKAQREWPFISCSDRNFTEVCPHPPFSTRHANPPQAEWNRYKQVCLSEGLSVPTKPELIDKIDDINALVKRQWTDQELSEKLKRQNDLHAKFSGVERAHLTKQLEMAHARGDFETVNRLQEKLDTLEVPRLAFRTSLTSALGKKKADNKGLSQQEKLALLNAENRKRNAEAVRKAQLKERARAREIEMTPDGVVAKKAGLVAVEGGNMNSGASTPGVNGNGNGNGTGVRTPKNDLAPHIAKLQEQQRSAAKTGMPVIHKPLMDDDIIGALDLDIDVEID